MGFRALTVRGLPGDAMNRAIEREHRRRDRREAVTRQPGSFQPEPRELSERERRAARARIKAIFGRSLVRVKDGAAAPAPPPG